MTEMTRAEFERKLAREGRPPVRPADWGIPPPLVPDLPEVRAHLHHLRLEGKSETAVYARGRALARLQAKVPVPVTEATADHLHDWRSALIGLADAYALSQVSHVRSFYAWLADEGHRPDNPASRILARGGKPPANWGAVPPPVPDLPEVKAHLLYLGLEGKSPETVYARARALARAQAVIPVPLTEAREADLYQWRLSLAARSDAYVLSQVSHVRSFYLWLADEGYRPDNPARRIPVPRKPSPLPHPIGEAELADALDHAPARIRIWLVLAAWCGLRAKEIACLRRKYVREHGPNPHIFVAADATKGHYEAIVPLCEFAVTEIRVARLPLTGWAFPRLDGQPGHVTPHRVSSLCCEFLHGLGYPDTLHALRHRFGTEALRASGGNVRTAQRLLRHARLDTTAIYTLITDDEAAAAVAAIPAPRRLAAVPARKAAS